MIALLFFLQADAAPANPGWSFLAGKYDADRDGRIVASEYARGVASFLRLDRDGDGAVTAADFEAEWSERWQTRYLQAPQLQALLLDRFQGDAEPALARAEFLRRVSRVDGNADGRLCSKEFAAISSASAPIGEDGAAVTWAEFAALLDAASDADVPHAALAARFDELDVNQDGLLLPAGHPQRDLPLRPGRKPLALIFGSFT